MPSPSAIRVADLMSGDPVTVAPSARVSDVLTLLVEREIGSVVVVEDGRPVGIFTERDVLHGAASEQPGWRERAIAELMTPEPFTASPGERWDDAMDRMGQHGVRHLPVVEAGRVVGMLAMRDIARHRTGVLESLVRERTEELQRQNELLEVRDRERSEHLLVAARIQRHLQPSAPPTLPPFEVAVHFQPHDEVAGDYWDGEALGEDALGLVLADVSGHGVPAAFAAAMAKTTYALRCREVRDPGEVLREMNAVLTDLLSEQFVTMLAARLDADGPALTFARAGHPPPLLFRPGEGVRELDADGMMLGVRAGASFPESRVELAAGDRVVLYTDGLTEARDLRGNFLGVEALASALERHGASSAENLLRALVGVAQRHVGHLAFADDLTALVVAVGQR